MALDQHGALLKMGVIVSQHHLTGRLGWSWLAWFICLSARKWASAPPLDFETVDRQQAPRGVERPRDLQEPLHTGPVLPVRADHGRAAGRLLQLAVHRDDHGFERGE